MTDSAGFAKIDAPYLLLTFILIYVDENDRVWPDRSWLRDFERHSEYIRQLTLLAPRHPCRIDITDMVPVGEPAMAATRFVGVKLQTSLHAALISLQSTVATLWREVRRSRIVHSVIAGVTGWLVPPDDSAVLAQAIGELAANTDTLRSRGLAARRIADQLAHRAIRETRSTDLARLRP